MWSCRGCVALVRCSRSNCVTAQGRVVGYCANVQLSHQPTTTFTFTFEEVDRNLGGYTTHKFACSPSLSVVMPMAMSPHYLCLSPVTRSKDFVIVMSRLGRLGRLRCPVFAGNAAAVGDIHSDLVPCPSTTGPAGQTTRALPGHMQTSSP